MHYFHQRKPKSSVDFFKKEGQHAPEFGYHLARKRGQHAPFFENRRRKKGVNICRNDRQISLRKEAIFLSLGGG